MEISSNFIDLFLLVGIPTLLQVTYAGSLTGVDVFCNLGSCDSAKLYLSEP